MSDDEEVRTAIESLRSAEELAGERVEEDIADVADALGELAERERAPDQTRVRGHKRTLRDIHERATDDARKHLESAMEDLDSVGRP